MPVTVSKPAFNLREALNSLRRKMGAKGLELLRANTAEEAYAALNPGMFRNRLINGDMRIDQRNDGASVSNGGFAVDRWQTVLTAITSLTNTSQRVTDVPTNQGFTHSYKVTITSVATAYGSGGRCGVLHRIEGFNTSDLRFGSVHARSITLSFWVKSSDIGSYSVSVLNNDSTRAYPATYQIEHANTWEYKTIVIPGEVSGTWLTDNGRGFQVEFCLGADTSRLGVANSWNSSFVTGASGTKLLTNVANATFFLTGVQLEAGTVATPFERRSYAAELALCQRYYYQNSTQSHFLSSFFAAVGSGDHYANYPLPVSMRAAPTATLSLGSDVVGVNNVACTARTNNMLYLTFTKTATSGYYSLNSVAASAEL